MTVTNQSSFPTTSWKDQIVNNPKADQLITESIAYLADITPEKDTAYLLDTLTVEESYILSKSSDSNTLPILIHHPLIVKGTKADGGIGTKSLILHQGLSNHALPFTTNPADLLKLVEDVPNPSYQSLFEASTIEDLRAIEPFEENATTSDTRACIIIPHFIASEFINSEPACAKSFITIIKNHLDIYDDIFYIPKADDPDTTPDEDKVQTFHQILTWLLHFEEKIPVTTLNPIFQGTRLYEASDRFQKGFITTPFSPTASVLRPHDYRNDTSIQESSISIQNSIASSMERITEKFEEKDTKNKSFDKLNNLSKKTLLAFATADRLNPALKLGDEGLDIMKQKNDTDAHALLQTTLETKSLYYAKLSIANAKDICNRRWARHNSNMPSGLSVLLVQEYDMTSGSSSAHDAMILRLKTKHVIDDESISKLLETDITMPTIFEDMMKNIKVVDGIIEAFAPNSWAARCYENVIADLLKIEKDCKKLILEDSLFIIKILCDIDNRTSTKTVASIQTILTPSTMIVLI